MSLTSELHDPQSAINRWYAANMKMSFMTFLVEQVNRQLAKQRVLAASYKIAPGTMGTAFDYAFRWQVEPLDASRLVAMHGAMIVDRMGLLNQVVQMGNDDPASRAACSVVLAWFEQTYRHAAEIPQLQAVKSAPELLTFVAQDEIDDIKRLTQSIPAVWGDRLIGPYFPNPTFAGSNDVGGADADWILGGVLYDCKCSWKRRPFTLDHLKQVIGYCFLDYFNRYSLTGFGLYFPRHETLLQWDIEKLIPNFRERQESLIEALQDAKPGDLFGYLDEYDNEFDFC